MPIRGYVTQKAMHESYDLHRDTFLNKILKNEDLLNELTEAGWDGVGFFPKHQMILYKKWGDPYEMKYQNEL